MLTATSPALTRWRPTDAEPWNLKRVWHLHRRAGFGATWQELQRDLQRGPDESIDDLIAGLDNNATDDQFERMSTVISNAAVGSNNINRLKAWWLYRMLKSPHSLQERLTLMWHDHFATSNMKVQDVGLMRSQNDSLRRHAAGDFSALLRAMAHDPAMLVWLDANANRKEHPNENLAREIMELFSLGVGNYREKDIKEAARALTGWTVKQGKFVNLKARHDSGEKTILKQRGNWDGDDYVSILIEQQATSKRIAFRIGEFLLSESLNDELLIDELANGLVNNNLNIKWAVETVLRSKAFFADENLSQQVLSPVEFVVGAIRCLEINNPLPSTLLLAEMIADLGHDLFNPPNVFGWPGGRSWLTSRAIIGRANFATELVAGELDSSPSEFDAEALLSHYHIKSDERDRFFAQLLLGTQHVPVELNSLARNPKQLVTAILSSPEAFLG